MLPDSLCLVSFFNVENIKKKKTHIATIFQSLTEINKLIISSDLRQKKVLIKDFVYSTLGHMVDFSQSSARGLYKTETGFFQTKAYHGFTTS